MMMVIPIRPTSMAARISTMLRPRMERRAARRMWMDLMGPSVDVGGHHELVDRRFARIAPAQRDDGFRSHACAQGTRGNGDDRRVVVRIGKRGFHLVHPVRERG